jgi:hypothetical protein
MYSYPSIRGNTEYACDPNENNRSWFQASFETIIMYARFVDWLCWGETDVSELRPLRAYCSSPGDCHVDHGMMVSTGANS